MAGTAARRADPRRRAGRGHHRSARRRGGPGRRPRRHRAAAGVRRLRGHGSGGAHGDPRPRASSWWSGRRGRGRRAPARARPGRPSGEYLEGGAPAAPPTIPAAGSAASRAIGRPRWARRPLGAATWCAARRSASGVRVGLTLPSFREDPEDVVTVARAADAAGVDGVFAYDHVFRTGADGTRRPALEMSAVLGLVAAETTRVVVGTLVARVTMRPVATLVVILDTAHRVSGGRLVAGLGSGDAESRPEHEAYGLPFPPLADRVSRLEEAVGTVAWTRLPGVGRRHPPAACSTSPAGAPTAGTAGEAGPTTSGASCRSSRPPPSGRGGPPPDATWGGLVVLGATPTPPPRRPGASAAGHGRRRHAGAGRRPAAGHRGPRRHLARARPARLRRPRRRRAGGRGADVPRRLTVAAAPVLADQREASRRPARSRLPGTTRRPAGTVTRWSSAGSTPCRRTSSRRSTR